MSREELREAVMGIFRTARAVRRAYPDTDAMQEITIGERPAALPGADGAGDELMAALGCLWDEVALVRGGRANTLAVLDDEIALTEYLADCL